MFFTFYWMSTVNNIFLYVYSFNYHLYIVSSSLHCFFLGMGKDKKRENLCLCFKEVSVVLNLPRDVVTDHVKHSSQTQTCWVKESTVCYANLLIKIVLPSTLMTSQTLLNFLKNGVRVVMVVTHTFYTLGCHLFWCTLFLLVSTEATKFE